MPKLQWKKTAHRTKVAGLTKAIFIGGAILVTWSILDDEPQLAPPIGVHVFEDGSVYVDPSIEAQNARSDQWLMDCANPKNSSC